MEATNCSLTSKAVHATKCHNQKLSMVGRHAKRTLWKRLVARCATMVRW